MTKKKRVVVAMSGGVDSSVAAALLLREGYDVAGVTMRLWTDEEAALPHRGCCVLGADDARAVCRVLGIPHHVVNLEAEFAGEVVEYFCREYGRGRTPNPCLACNERVKFKHLLARALAMGADYLATGHYARIRRAGGECELLRGVDEDKDQSYVLYTVGQEELSRLLFPVGEYRKAEVRRLAAESGLPVADKPDSVEVCFIPNDDYRSFLAGRIGQEPGDILDRAGRVVGRHQGVAAYTIGQRHGLGVALGEALRGRDRYVSECDNYRRGRGPAVGLAAGGGCLLGQRQASPGRGRRGGEDTVSHAGCRRCREGRGREGGGPLPGEAAGDYPRPGGGLLPGRARLGRRHHSDGGPASAGRRRRQHVILGGYGIWTYRTCVT